MCPPPLQVLSTPLVIWQQTVNPARPLAAVPFIVLVPGLFNQGRGEFTSISLNGTKSHAWYLRILNKGPIIYCNQMLANVGPGFCGVEPPAARTPLQIDGWHFWETSCTFTIWAKRLGFSSVLQISTICCTHEQLFLIISWSSLNGVVIKGSRREEYVYFHGTLGILNIQSRVVLWLFMIGMFNCRFASCGEKVSGWRGHRIGRFYRIAVLV